MENIGRQTEEMNGRPEARSTPRRAVAALLSLFAPGLGQLCAGRLIRGWGALGVWVGLLFPLIVLAWYLAGGSIVKVGFAGLVTLGCLFALPPDAWRCEPAPGWRGSSRLRRCAAGIPLLTAIVLVQFFAEHFLRHHLLEAFQAPSEGMAPTLLPGDDFFVDHGAYRHLAVGAGDVVAYRIARSGDIPLPADLHPDLPTELRVGRVRGIGGDDAEFITGRRRTVEPGRFWIVGDNPERSLDSRYFGSVDQTDIVGRVAYVYFSRDPSSGAVRWGRIGRIVE